MEAAIASINLVADKMRIMFYMMGPKEIADVAQKQGTEPKLLVEAVPLFFILIGIELIVGLLKGKNVYRFNDSLISVLLGSFQTIAGVWFVTLEFAIFAWVYEHFHILELNVSGWPMWILAMLLRELAYYWSHRTAHEFHILWVGHSVHHSGEDYNLATALRQGVIQAMTLWVFSIPIALLIPPSIYACHRGLNTLYQFWVHTTMIGSLGPLEYVLNTPSHHRVHHRPPGNANYGGVLIIYDRMFGTFVPEDEQKDHYGLVKQYETFDPTWANAEHFWRMCKNLGRNKEKNLSFYFGLLSKRRIKHRMVFRPLELFKPIPTPKRSLWGEAAPNKRVRYDGGTSSHHPVLRIYVSLLFLASMTLTVGSMIAVKHLDAIEIATIQISSAVLFSCVGRLLDGFDKGQQRNTARILAFLCLSSWSAATMQDNMKLKVVYYVQISCVFDALCWFAMHQIMESQKTNQ